MALRLPGFTRASSLGPIAMFLDAHGSSVGRVLETVDLPFAIIEQPEIVVPLREQFRFLESAARDVGDPCFGARLGQAVKAQELSAFGAWICTADTLAAGIQRAHAGISAMLQTSTLLTLSRHGSFVRWSIAFVEPESEGRHHNEFLGLGYMISLVRAYAGAGWRPNLVMSALPRGTPSAELEEIFGTNVSHGHAVPAIDFDARLLAVSPLVTADGRVEASSNEPTMPGPNDLVATVASVIELALHDGYPRVEWVASKLGLTRRSLQRRLHEQGAMFNHITENLLKRRAEVLLGQGDAAVTEVALMLGYADPAHFTRAFRRWTGMTPSQFRAEVRNH